VRAFGGAPARSPERERGSSSQHCRKPWPAASLRLSQNAFEVASGAVDCGVAIEVVLSHGSARGARKPCAGSATDAHVFGAPDAHVVIAAGNAHDQD
jgi:hypothetical protein